MALGDTVQVNFSPEGTAEATIPVSGTAVWQTIIDAGGPANADVTPGNTITNPDSQITSVTTHILQRKAKGTTLLLRLGYDDGLTAITDPIVQVFGRTGDDEWELLPNTAQDLSVTLTTAATDTTDGTYKYTTVYLNETAWDCRACDEILVGIIIALAGTGTVNNSFIQAKFV